MNKIKTTILNNICYTPLVYIRINKKLKLESSHAEIEKMIYNLIDETKEFHFNKIGKNFYITNQEHMIRVTINSHTFRVITVDKILKINVI